MVRIEKRKVGSTARQLCVSLSLVDLLRLDTARFYSCLNLCDRTTGPHNTDVTHQTPPKVLSMTPSV
jgi:hypothetical protein